MKTYVSASNEYPQHMFLCRNKKIINTFGLKKAPKLVLWGQPMVSTMVLLYVCAVWDSTMTQHSAVKAVKVVLYMDINQEGEALLSKSGDRKKSLANIPATMSWQSMKI